MVKAPPLSGGRCGSGCEEHARSRRAAIPRLISSVRGGHAVAFYKLSSAKLKTAKPLAAAAQD